MTCSFDIHLMECYGLYFGFSLMLVPIDFFPYDFCLQMKVFVDFNMELAEEHELNFMIE